MSWLRRWWREPDYYDRLSSHLQTRGVAGANRAVIAAISFGLAILAPATIWTPAGPRNDFQLACTITASAGAVVAGLLWARSWPTRAVAIRFAVLSNVCIALLTLGLSDPTVATLACMVLAALATYIAAFHNAPLLVYNMVVAAALGGLETVRVAETRTVLGALCGYGAVLLLNIAVPCTIQMVVHILGSDAVRAERDELTGLLTRRAFHRLGKALLERARDQRVHAVITVIDLDRFKLLNDTYGHSTGDDALVSVARALTDTTDDSAVICRAGGEEFVIADVWHPDEVDRRARQLCEEIAALPFGITASVGTAGIHPACRTGNVGEVLKELIAAADTAMYAAKRRGGNQAGHHEWSPPLASSADDETDDRDDEISA